MRIRNFKINLREVGDVNKFVQLVARCQIDADVHAENNSRHVVPADSLMGLFSLDLTKKLIVDIVSADEENIDQFVMGCESAGWIVE